MITFFTQNSEIILRLGVATVLGMLIGAERIFVHKEAGMKTHALVALGSAVFIVISEMIAIKYIDIGNFDPSRMASQVIVGIGFLGAGAIMLQGSRVKGLTTAGGLWVTAGIGIAVGFGFFSLAIISTVIVLMIFILMIFVERPIKKIFNEIEDTTNGN